MDGVSRGKLVKAGYKIFRMREAQAGGSETYEIREKSDRGDWVLYGSYPTKAARERAWRELAKDEKHMMEGEIEDMADTDTTVNDQAVAPVTEDRAKWEADKEHKYELLKVQADTKIKGAAMRENFERLLRVMFLRETKERLKESGLWTRYCQDTGIDIKNADYEIAKIGEIKDDALLIFGEHCGYDINKLRHLTSGDSAKCSEKLGVTVQNGQLMLHGEVVPLTPEDVEHVVTTLQADSLKREEEATEEKVKEAKAHADTKKALKKAERELKKIRGDAAKAEMTPVEHEYLQELDRIKADYDAVLLHMESQRIAYMEREEPATPRMRAAYASTLDYMYAQMMAAADAAEQRKG